MKARPRRSGPPRPGSLLLRFGVVSAILAGVLGLVLTSWLGNFIRTTNIDNARGTAEYSLSLSLNALDVPANQSALITPAQLAETTRMMRASVATGRFVGATAWIAPGIVAYAAEPSRMGKLEQVRPEVTAAFKGQVTTAIVRHPLANVPDATERRGLRNVGPLLEIYAAAHMKSRVVAAVVLYQPWLPIERMINHETHQMLLLVLASLLVLWLCVMRLVLTASRRLRAQAKENWLLASHDGLTGLPNRTMLTENVAQALKNSERTGRHVGLLLFDLDRFKEVNDTFGHHTGDLLLKEIGPRLSSILRDDDFVARLGGDEFVVVLPGLRRPDEAEITAARLLKSLAEPFRLDNLTLDVDASIGIAVSPGHGTDYHALLRHADTGMYLAKNSGTGFAIYSGTAESARPRQRPMVESLRAAVADPAQFVVLYQPKANLRTGVVHGVQALLLWQHPGHGRLLPAEFLPLAEKSGLVIPLTDHLLETVLRDIHEWSGGGLQLGVSVNVSMRCLLDASFPARIATLLERHGVEAGMLEIEFTEAILADVVRATAVLGKLDELGVRLALSGFGSGLSSLGHLTRLPLHQLKIDPSLMTSMPEGSTEAAVVRSCIELARNLGLGVVADGVETADVWSRLASFGCELAQGPYLAEPMPAGELAGWIRERARFARLAKRARRGTRQLSENGQMISY